MPVHDWTRVETGIFHDFHLEWISSIKRELNHGVLPKSYYAMAEQIAGGLEPDVLTLKSPTNDGLDSASLDEVEGGLALATKPPQVWRHSRVEHEVYANKAKAIAIRHVSNHKVVAVIEIVSPGNKASQHALFKFVEKAEELLRNGIHLLVVDLFPPGPRDPAGIHKPIWDTFVEEEYALPEGRPLTLASYIGGPTPESFVEPTAVGADLPEMPLFLTPAVYVPVPLERAYQSAWEAVPSFWQDVLAGPQEEPK